MADSNIRPLSSTFSLIQLTVSFCYALSCSILFICTPSFLVRRKSKRGLLFLYLIQDIDILASASQAFKKHFIPHIVYVDAALIKKHPKIFLLLWKHRMHYFFSLSPKRNLSLLSRVDRFSFFLTAVETSWRPHAPAHQLVQQANKLGVPTYTCQHGYENIGLTFDEVEHPIQKTHIASKTIFIWSSKELLHPRVPKETRSKCIEAGFLKSLYFDDSLAAKLPSQYRLKIGVFENLHWLRFSKGYRDNFISCLTDITVQFPQVLFVLKPHPAGQWLTKNKHWSFREQENVLVLSHTPPSMNLYSSIDWIGNIDAVMTTPSTVAVDGALLGKPVGMIASSELELHHYEPLSMLLNFDDWITFINAVLFARDSLVYLSNTFIRKSSIRKDGWKFAAQDILKELASSSSSCF